MFAGYKNDDFDHMLFDHVEKKLIRNWDVVFFED